MIPIEASAKQKPNTSGVGLTGSKPSRSQSRAHGFQTTTVTFILQTATSAELDQCKESTTAVCR